MPSLRVLFLVAVVGGVPAARAQGVPIRKSVADTVKKRPVRTAGGEVALPAPNVVRAAVDSALAVERGISAKSELYARETQRLLDSINAAYAVQRATAAVWSEVAARHERARLDSIAAAEQSAREAADARRRHLARGIYAGLAGGVSIPRHELRSGYSGGFDATAPVGWDDDNSPFGIRADLSVDHLARTPLPGSLRTGSASSRDLTVWSLNADLKLRTHAPGTPGRTNVYALGGVGLHRLVGGIYGITGADAGRTVSFSDSKMSLGWNLGGGVAVEWGPAELFVETRYINVRSNLSNEAVGGVGAHAAFAPIVLGLQWF